MTQRKRKAVFPRWLPTIGWRVVFHGLADFSATLTEHNGGANPTTVPEDSTPKSLDFLTRLPVYVFGPLFSSSKALN